MLSIYCKSCLKLWKKIGKLLNEYQKSEKNNLVVALNILYVKNDKICRTFVSKQNSKLEKHATILMIPNGEGWHYIKVKQLSGLLRKITSKSKSDFYYLSCLHSFTTKNALESNKKYAKVKILVVLTCVPKTKY